MRQLITILAIAFLIAGCSRLPGEPEYVSMDSAAIETYEDGLPYFADRFIDTEAGVVCYTVGRLNSVPNSISCLPLDQTELEVEK